MAAALIAPRASSSRSLLASLPVLLPAAANLLLPPISTLLPEWILRAVPKKKVSHSRKSMRSANKGLHEKTNISTCASCGHAKRKHHFCPNCYGFLTKRWKSELAAQRKALEPEELAQEDLVEPQPKREKTAWEKWFGGRKQS